MHRFRHALPASAVLALALSPLTAAAGPILSPPAWTLTATVVGVPGQTTMYLGRYDYWAGPSDERVVYVHAPLPAGGSAYQNSHFTPDGWTQIAGSSKGIYDFRPDAPTGADAVASYRVLLELTDTASGEVGRSEFTGGAYFPNGLPQNSYGEVIVTGETTARHTLGGRTYDLTVRESDGDSTSFFMAKVAVSAPEATPEPATLALAGLGLAAIGVARLRRVRGGR